VKERCAHRRWLLSAPACLVALVARVQTHAMVVAATMTDSGIATYESILRVLGSSLELEQRVNYARAHVATVEHAF
jgi:hypothetical protein